MKTAVDVIAEIRSTLNGPEPTMWINWNTGPIGYSIFVHIGIYGERLKANQAIHRACGMDDFSFAQQHGLSKRPYLDALGRAIEYAMEAK